MPERDVRARRPLIERGSLLRPSARRLPLKELLGGLEVCPSIEKMIKAEKLIKAPAEAVLVDLDGPWTYETRVGTAQSATGAGPKRATRTLT